MKPVLSQFVTLIPWCLSLLHTFVQFLKDSSVDGKLIEIFQDLQADNQHN